MYRMCDILHKYLPGDQQTATDLLQSGAGLYGRNLQGLTSYDMAAHTTHEDPNRRLQVRK